MRIQESFPQDCGRVIDLTDMEKNLELTHSRERLCFYRCEFRTNPGNPGAARLPCSWEDFEAARLEKAPVQGLSSFITGRCSAHSSCSMHVHSGLENPASVSSRSSWIDSGSRLHGGMWPWAWPPFDWASFTFHVK